MTNKEIMEKALAKIDFPNIEGINNLKPNYKGVDDLGNVIMEFFDIELSYAYELIIYSNWFAKAFWGEKMINKPEFEKEHIIYLLPAWKYHQQQMVICELPLEEYLQKFVE